MTTQAISEQSISWLQKVSDLYTDYSGIDRFILIENEEEVERYNELSEHYGLDTFPTFFLDTWHGRLYGAEGYHNTSRVYFVCNLGV